MVANTLRDRGLSLRAVSYKTQIHHSTVGEMQKGVVPGRDIVEDFARGLSLDPKPLLIAAGYEQPSDALTAVQFALRDVENISEAGRQQIREFVEKVQEKYPAEGEPPADAEEAGKEE